MTPKSKNILVGIFVIVLSVGMISFVTWLGSSVVGEETNPYVSYLDEAVSGLSPNSSVKYKGVAIGIVERIRINPENSNQVELRLQIEQGTPIKVDSELILESQGITGLQYIEITGGSENAALLLPDSENEIPVIKTGKSTLATVQAAIGPMLGNINLTIEEIRKILINTKAENLSLILSDVQKITSIVAEKSDPFFNDITEASANLKRVTNQTEKLVENVNQYLISPDSQFVSLLEKLNKSTETFNQLMKETERKQLVAVTSQTLKSVNQLTNNLNKKMDGQWNELIVELKNSSQTINKLLNQVAEKEIVQDVSSTIGRVDQLAQEIQISTQKANTLLDEIIDKNIIEETEKIMVQGGQLTLAFQTASQTMNQLLNDISDQALVQKVSKTIAQVDQLVQEVQVATQTTNSLLKKIAEQKMVQNTSRTINKANSLFDSLQKTPENINRLLEELTQSTNNIDSLAQALNKQIDSPEFESLTNEASSILKSTNKISRSLNQIIDEADVTTMIEELKITLQEIQELSERWSRVGESLENNPSSFFFGDSKNEIRISQ